MVHRAVLCPGQKAFGTSSAVPDLCWRGNCRTGWHSQHRKIIQEEINGCRNPNTYLSGQGTQKTRGKKEEHKSLDIVLLTMIEFIRLC